MDDLAKELTTGFTPDRLGDYSYGLLGFDEAERHVFFRSPVSHEEASRKVRARPDGKAVISAVCGIAPSVAGRLLGSRALEPGDQVVRLQLLEPLADCIELACRVLDQLAALLHELERLAQAGLVRVEAGGDRLQPVDLRLVGARLRRHRDPSLA